jgi:hypothetical protein
MDVDNKSCDEFADAKKKLRRAKTEQQFRQWKRSLERKTYLPGLVVTSQLAELWVMRSNPAKL